MIILFSRSALRHICRIKNLQLGHGLHMSVNDRVILPFCEGFIFAKLSMLSFVKINPLENFRIYSNAFLSVFCSDVISTQIISYTNVHV